MSHHHNNNQDDNNDDHYYHHPNPSSPFSSLSPSSTQINTTSLFSKDNNNHYHIQQQQQQQQQPYLSSSSSSSSSSLPIIQPPVHSFNPYNEDDLNYYHHHHHHSGTNVPTSSSQVPPPPIPYHLLLSKQQQQQSTLQGEEDSFVLQSSSSSSHVPLDQQQQQPYHHYNPTTTTTTTIDYNNDMNDMEAITTITTTTTTNTNTNDEEDQLLMMEQYEEHLLSDSPSSSSSYLTYFEQNKITKHSLFLIQLYKGFMYTMHTLQSLLHIQFNRHSSSSSSSSSFSLSSLNNNKSVMSIKKLLLFWLIHSLFIGATLLFVLGMGVLCGYLTVQYGIWSRPLGAPAKEWHRFLLVLPYNYIMLWVLAVMVACTLYMMILFLVVYLPCKMILDYSFKFYVRVVHNQLKNEIRDQMNRLNHDLTMDAQELQSPVQLSSSPSSPTAAPAPNRTPQRKQEQAQQQHHSKDLQSMLTGHMKSFVKQNFASVMDNVNMGSDNNNQSMLNNEQLTWQFIWNDFVHYCKFYVRNKLKRNLRRIAIRFLMSVLFTNGIGALFALLIPGFGIVVSLCCFLFSTGLNTALIGLDVIFDEKSYNIWEQQRTVWNHLWLIVGMGLAQSLIGCVPIVGLFLMYPICTITSTRFLYHLEYWGQSGKCDEFWNLPLIESCVPYCVAFYPTPHSRRHTNGSWFRIAHQSKRQEMSLSYADHHSEDDSGDGIDHALDNIIQMLLVQQQQ